MCITPSRAVTRCLAGVLASGTQSQSQGMGYRRKGLKGERGEEKSNGANFKHRLFEFVRDTCLSAYVIARSGGG